MNNRMQSGAVDSSTVYMFIILYVCLETTLMSIRKGINYGLSRLQNILLLFKGVK